MKTRNLKTGILLVLLVGFSFVSAQENITIVTPTTEVAEWLDLHAVAEIFKDAENIEDFERDLNDPELGINNLDLDEDGYVDYIRVVEQITDYTHLIILQVLLGEDEYQDIATIEIEKTEDDEYNLQVHGNEVFYGDDYYVTPRYVHVYRWPIITWIYRPVYRPYRSVYYFGYYPRWWKPYRHVTHHVYQTRTVRYTRRATFKVTRVSRVKTVHRVKYKPRSSTLVSKNVKVIHKKPRKTEVKKIPRKNAPLNAPKRVKRSYKASDKRSDKIFKRTSKKPLIKKDMRTTVKKTNNKTTYKRKTSSVKSKPKRSDYKKPSKNVVKKKSVSRANAKPAPKKSTKKSNNKKVTKKK